MTHVGKGGANGPLKGAGPAVAYRHGPRRLEMRPPWPTAVGSYRRAGRRQPRLYKGQRWPPPPTRAAASSSPAAAPTSPPGKLYFFLVNLFSLEIN
jgi:hypothetical protein